MKKKIRDEMQLMKKISYDNIYESLNIIYSSVQCCREVMNQVRSPEQYYEAAIFINNVMNSIERKIIVADEGLKGLYGSEYGENPPKLLF